MTAQQFAAEGARLVLGDINDTALSTIVKDLNERYPDCGAEGLKCDVSKEDQVKGLVDRAVEKWGRLDVMVRGLCLFAISTALRLCLQGAVQQCWNHAPCVSTRFEYQVKAHDLGTTTPSIPRRRFGISLRISTSRVFGLGANMP